MNQEYNSPNRNINQNRRNDDLHKSIICFDGQNGNSFSHHEGQMNINNEIPYDNLRTQNSTPFRPRGEDEVERNNNQVVPNNNIVNRNDSMYQSLINHMNSLKERFDTLCRQYNSVPLLSDSQIDRNNMRKILRRIGFIILLLGILFLVGGVFLEIIFKLQDEKKKKQTGRDYFMKQYYDNKCHALSSEDGEFLRKECQKYQIGMNKYNFSFLQALTEIIKDLIINLVQDVKIINFIISLLGITFFCALWFIVVKFVLG